MYRFADKSLSDDEFQSGLKLEKLLNNIFCGNKPDLSDQEAFIFSIKETLRKKSVSKYVDTFIIERGKGQFFSLFFFTNHSRGAEKMLNTKWNLDAERGKGFRLGTFNQTTLYNGIEGSNYPRLLLNFITEEDKVTNSDIYEFGLENGFLPTHSNKTLNQLKSEKKITVKSKDGKPVKGNYIKFKPKRLIEFKRRK
jgi:hypothetical protein